MHEQNEEFTRQHDEFTRQMLFSILTSLEYTLNVPSAIFKMYPKMTRCQFNKTFTRIIYKCSYCSQTQWLHLSITCVKCGRGKIKMPIKLY